MTEYAFYDNEATGISVRHDQITQFGGLITDGELRIKERMDISIRLLPYVVPHPKALQVTGKRADDLTDPNLPTEYEASREIGRFLRGDASTERVYVTYNGLSYDDELLRTTLFRNLNEPYFNSGRNHLKIDLLELVRAIHGLAPNAISFPVDENGKVSYRLEKICPANGIEIAAHDAFGDSLATMELFRLVQAKAPWAIDIARRCGSARSVEAMLREALDSGDPVFRLTSFGKTEIVPLAVVATDGKKKFLGYDPRREAPPPDPTEIAAQLFNPASPFTLLAANRFPILLTAEEVASMTDLEADDVLRDSAKRINGDAAFCKASREALSLNSPKEVNEPSSEEMIYSGFPSRGDKANMARFHSAPTWEDKAQVPFEDARFRDFAARLVLEAVRCGRCSLPASVLSRLSEDCAAALTRPFAPPSARHATLASVIAEEAASDEWVEWALGRYGRHPALDGRTPAAPANEPGQLAFGF